MRTRNTALSLVVVLVLLCLLVLVVEQNRQLANWTLFGQSFTLSAGIVAATAMLIGFLLATLFVVVFVGAPASVATTTATATTETQSERDFIESREQYRQLQAEYSRLQTIYNQLVVERDLARDQAATTPTMTSPAAENAVTTPTTQPDATEQVHPASPLYPMSVPPATPLEVPEAANAHIVSPASPNVPANTSVPPDNTARTVTAYSTSPQPTTEPPANADEPKRDRVWGVSDQHGTSTASNDAVSGTAVPSDTGDPNTFIAVPSLPYDESPADGEDRQDPPLRQLPVLTKGAEPVTDVEAPVSVSSSDQPDRTVPTTTAGADTSLNAGTAAPQRDYYTPDAGAAPTDTRVELPPSRQVIRPDGTILSGEDNPLPPPEENPNAVVGR